MYALFPLRVTRMHLRCAFPVLRPVVVITPNPDGGRAKKNGNINALRTRPSLAWDEGHAFRRRALGFRFAPGGVGGGGSRSWERDVVEAEDLGEPVEGPVSVESRGSALFRSRCGRRTRAYALERLLGGRSAHRPRIKGRQPLVDDDRVEIGSGWPCHRAGLAVDRNLGEELRVPQRLEHRPVEFAFEAHVSYRPVVESHAQAVVTP
jgi:hypothetical protein